eukprot:PhM_4_TR18684/c3_g4_i3/m.46364
MYPSSNNNTNQNSPTALSIYETTYLASTKMIHKATTSIVNNISVPLPQKWKSDLQPVDEKATERFVAVVCVELTDTEALWWHEPDATALAVTTYARVLHTVAAAQGAVEIACTAERWQLAFADSTNALRFCHGVQHKLMNVEWPHALLAYDGGREVSATSSSSSSRVALRGLRCRMGVHCGNSVCVPHVGRGRIDVVGPVRSASLGLCHRARGGEVFVSHDVIDNMERTDLLIMEKVGTMVDADIGIVEIFSCLSPALSARRKIYPPLEDEVAENIANVSPDELATAKTEQLEVMESAMMATHDFDAAGFSPTTLPLILEQQSTPQDGSLSLGREDGKRPSIMSLGSTNEENGLTPAANIYTARQSVCSDISTQEVLSACLGVPADGVAEMFTSSSMPEVWRRMSESMSQKTSNVRGEMAHAHLRTCAEKHQAVVAAATAARANSVGVRGDAKQNLDDIPLSISFLQPSTPARAAGVKGNNNNIIAGNNKKGSVVSGTGWLTRTSSKLSRPSVVGGLRHTAEVRALGKIITAHSRVARLLEKMEEFTTKAGDVLTGILTPHHHTHQQTAISPQKITSTSAKLQKEFLSALRQHCDLALPSELCSVGDDSSVDMFLKALDEHEVSIETANAMKLSDPGTGPRLLRSIQAMVVKTIIHVVVHEKEWVIQQLTEAVPQPSSQAMMMNVNDFHTASSSILSRRSVVSQHSPPTPSTTNITTKTSSPAALLASLPSMGSSRALRGSSGSSSSGVTGSGSGRGSARNSSSHSSSHVVPRARLII